MLSQPCILIFSLNVQDGLIFKGALQTDAITEESRLKQAIEKLKELVDLEGGNSKVNPTGLEDMDVLLKCTSKDIYSALCQDWPICSFLDLPS